MNDDFDSGPSRAERQRAAKVQKKIARLAEQVNCQDGRKAPRCEYATMDERCTFAGTMSPQIHGEGNWYCRFHYSQLQGRLTEAEAAEKVGDRFANRQEGELQRDWRHEVMDAKIEEMKDDPLMKMAHVLANGECSRKDKADFMGLLRERIQGIGKKLPYEKSDREPGVRQENIYEETYQ